MRQSPSVHFLLTKSGNLVVGSNSVWWGIESPVDSAIQSPAECFAGALPQSSASPPGTNPHQVITYVEASGRSLETLHCATGWGLAPIGG